MTRRERDIRRTVAGEGLSLVSLGRRGNGHMAVTIGSGGRRVTLTASATPSDRAWLRAFRRDLRREVGR